MTSNRAVVLAFLGALAVTACSGGNVRSERALAEVKQACRQWAEIRVGVTDRTLTGGDIVEKATTMAQHSGAAADAEAKWSTFDRDTKRARVAIVDSDISALQPLLPPIDDVCLGEGGP